MAEPSFMVQNETIWRFLHILAGIVWIGMLYWFNLVNLPLLKFQLKKPYDANMAEKGTGPIMVKSLFWFRWGAAFTVLLGLMLIGSRAEALSGGNGFSAGLRAYFLENGYNGYSILLGVLLALVMAFNVWFIIWPRQQKILANNKRIADAATPQEEKDRLGAENAPMVKTATLASRANTWLSVPMLFGMVFGAHGYGSAPATLQGWLLPILVLLFVVALMWAMSSAPKKKA